MEGNRDEADRCLEIASRMLRDGRFAEAEKFAAKADRLFASARARDLVAEARVRLDKTGDSTANDEQPVGGGGGGGAGGEEPAEANRPNRQTDASAQQIEAVKQVARQKDYYAMLGVSRDAGDSEIKRAYKKLALLLHPDKNKAAGAAEAFKKVGQAAQVLSDPERRKHYDAFGADEDRAPRHQRQQHARTFETEFTAEEFFNIFFNSGNAHVYSRRGNRFQRETYQHTREAQGNYASVLQMLPILGLILLSMMSTFFISDPIYSINPSPKFPVMRITENLRIPYYVKDNFHNEYQGSLKRLEMSVEEDYLTTLRIGCQRERNYRDNMAWKARNFGDRYNANNFKMPSCDALNNLQRS